MVTSPTLRGQPTESTTNGSTAWLRTGARELLALEAAVGPPARISGSALIAASRSIHTRIGPTSGLPKTPNLSRAYE